MHLPKNISKILTIAAFGGMLFCCVTVTEVIAQSDKEKSDLEQVKSSSNFSSEGDRQELFIQPSEKKSTRINPSADQVTRDNSGYRVEEQKEVKEEGKSTLSFNIFLYVLDRFKEN